MIAETRQAFANRQLRVVAKMETALERFEAEGVLQKRIEKLEKRVTKLEKNATPRMGGRSILGFPDGGFDDRLSKRIKDLKK